MWIPKASLWGISLRCVRRERVRAQFVRGGFCGWRHDEQLVADTQHVIRENLPWFKRPLWLREFFPSPCGWHYVSFCREDCPCGDGERVPSSSCSNSLRHTQSNRPHVCVRDGLTMSWRARRRLRPFRALRTSNSTRVYSAVLLMLHSPPVPQQYPRTHKLSLCMCACVSRLIGKAARFSPRRSRRWGERQFEPAPMWWRPVREVRRQRTSRNY